jgi:hypothetical protein
VPKEIMLPVFIIDKANVNTVSKTPEERAIPSWDKVVAKS